MGRIPSAYAQRLPIRCLPAKIRAEPPGNGCETDKRIERTPSAHAQRLTIRCSQSHLNVRCSHEASALRGSVRETSTSSAKATDVKRMGRIPSAYPLTIRCSSLIVVRRSMAAWFHLLLWETLLMANL